MVWLVMISTEKGAFADLGWANWAVCLMRSICACPGGPAQIALVRPFGSGDVPQPSGEGWLASRNAPTIRLRGRQNRHRPWLTHRGSQGEGLQVRLRSIAPVVAFSAVGCAAPVCPSIGLSVNDVAEEADEAAIMSQAEGQTGQNAACHLCPFRPSILV